MKTKELCITILVAAFSAAAVAFAVVYFMQRHATVAGGFRVLDNSGHIRGQFKLFKDDTAYLIMHDAEGEESIRLCVEPGGSSYIWLMQSNACAALGVGTTRSYLHLEDANGEVMLTTGELNLKDTNGTHQLILRNLKMKE